MKNNSRQSVIRELKEGFPEMPGHFQEAVQEAIETQLAKPREKAAPARGKRRVRLALAFAAVLALGTSVFAAARGGLLPYLQDWMGTPEAELVQTEIEQEAKNAEGSTFAQPLWEISEAWYDGAYLMFYAQTSEEGRQYDLGSDHIYINGVDHLLNYQENTEGNYFCCVDLMQSGLEGSLDVVIPLKAWENIYEADEFGDMHVIEGALPEGEEAEGGGLLGSQEIHFTVQETDVVFAERDRTIPLEGGEVQLHYVGSAQSVTRIDFTYRLSGEDGKEKIQGLTGLFQAEDSEGNRADTGGGDAAGSVSVPEPYQDGEGYWCRDFSLQIKGLDKEKSSMVLAPYSLESDGEGKAVPGTETMLDYGKFTVEFGDIRE